MLWVVKMNAGGKELKYSFSEAEVKGTRLRKRGESDKDVAIRLADIAAVREGYNATFVSIRKEKVPSAARPA
jgi:hypothetical protein